MHMKNYIIWLPHILGVAISVSLAFNIDTRASQFNTERRGFPRKNVLPFMFGKNDGTPVTAPQQLDPSEETCRSGFKQTHQCFIMPEISLTDKYVPAKHFRLSVADVSNPSKVTVCRPSVAQACCDTMKDFSFMLTFQEYTNTVDLVFLFDGSASMTEAEFTQNKVFIAGIMNSLKNTSIKFAAVQFSSQYRKVFDFNDYEAGTAHEKLLNEPHMRDLTNTHKALTFVMNEIFENPDAGASPDVTKVLVLITDGDPSDVDRHGMIQTYDKKNIIRFVIGVKYPNLDKFRAIASGPLEKYAFRIENYNALTDTQENLQKKICNLEGFSVAGAGVLTGGNERYSVCYKIPDYLQQASLTPDFQECTKKTVDLVFLFDGSASMTEAEFTKNKDFIVGMMNSLKNSSIKFAAVQFSSDYRKVFDFNDYEAGTAHEKLMNEPHMRTLTNTYRALTFVMNEILENPDAGASPDATKVLVLITDGDPSDVDRDGIVIRYKEKNIIRFVIGVKYAKLDRFIASEPSDKYAFRIENYDVLDAFLKYFQKKIFNLEGLSVAGAGVLTGEMSQSGFSAVNHKGSIGSNSWQDSLLKPPLTDIRMLNDSYRESTVAVGQKNNASLYFMGAPSFELRGVVIFYIHDCNNWTVAQRLTGDQIGSYFGAELCSVDIDSDGNTDFLLVGAPLFYQPHEKREGQIYVYTLTDEMQLRSQLNVAVPSMGRFGTAISSLADLNGDGLRDVAVGAPLEDDNRGAVYIYLGDRHNGIRSSYSQRIMGQDFLLRFFGQAITGDIDHAEDGLPRIVIGSGAGATVFRSRPVFNVFAKLSIQPEAETIDCRGNTDENVPVATLTTCFEMVETTRSKAGMISAMNISYSLDVDPTTPISLGFFSSGIKTRNVTAVCELREKETCFKYSIYVLKCVENTSSPISIRLKYSQVDTEKAGAVLNVDGNRQVVIEVPLEHIILSD